MARSRKRKRLDATVALQLAEGPPLDLGELARAIREVNPSRLDLDDEERRARYAAKAALQSRAIVDHGDALQAVPTASPRIVALRRRAGRGDLGHARIDRLSPDARAWIAAQR